MDINRSKSPGPNFGSYRLNARRSTYSMGHDIGRGFLTSSLPSSEIQKEFDYFKSNALQRSQDSRNINYSPSSASILMFQRPRSASLHHTPIAVPPGKKKTLKTISRSRPSSAKGGGNGRNRSDSFNFEQEGNMGACKVEEQFAKIKNQLAKLSVEDTALQERLDRLASEISLIQRYATQLHHCPMSTARKKTFPWSPGPTCSIEISPPGTTSPTLLISGKGSNFGPLTEESWEDEYINMAQKSQDSLHNNSHQHVKIYKNDRNASLSDSEGLLSPNRATTHRIMILDHDKSPQPLSPMKYNFEDDVFDS